MFLFNDTFTFSHSRGVLKGPSVSVQCMSSKHYYHYTIVTLTLLTNYIVIILPLTVSSSSSSTTLDILIILAPSSSHLTSHPPGIFHDFLPQRANTEIHQETSHDEIGSLTWLPLKQVTFWVRHRNEELMVSVVGFPNGSLEKLS